MDKKKKPALGEVNPGRWPKDGITSKDICVGIRGNLKAMSKVLPPEVIFVAITGRDGDYRTKEGVDHILESLGLEIAYRHDVTEKGLSDSLWYGDGEHRKIFDGLVKYVDTVYPLPESEEEVEVSETEDRGADAPF